MDPQIIATLLFGAGAIIAVLVPYILKVYEEAATFDMQYLYGLIISVVVAALIAIPTEVDASFQGYAMIFMAGLGMQGAVNKGVSMLKKRRQ